MDCGSRLFSTGDSIIVVVGANTARRPHTQRHPPRSARRPHLPHVLQRNAAAAAAVHWEVAGDSVVLTLFIHACDKRRGIPDAFCLLILN